MLFFLYNSSIDKFFKIPQFNRTVIMYKRKHPDSSYFIVNAGDIHFSTKNAETLFSELNAYLIETIRENADLIDMVVLTGDIFHYELKMSSKAARFAYGFIAQLIDLCTKSKIVLRIIKGTETHDFGQINTLGVMYPDNEYFKVVTKVETEEVFEGFKVLYIPEEYPKDEKEYYSETVFNAEDNSYDFVFFHGTMDFKSFVSSAFESERHIEGAPTWRAKDVMRITKGIATGGHIHTPCNYKEKIFYHGSFSRMSQGEEESKGFNIYEYSATGILEVIRVENDMAPLYKQVNVIDAVIENSGNIEEIIKSLEKTLSDTSIKYRVNMSKDIKDDYPEIHSVIREFLSGRSNVDFKEVINKKIPKLGLESGNQVPEDISINDKLNFLNDRSLSTFEKISKFAETVMDEKISANDIELVISNN